MLLAGIDGIQNQIEPPAPIDKDLYNLADEEKAKIASVPASLGEALDALENDFEYLLAGDVFTSDLLQMWVDLKREEIRSIGTRPHPMEFDLYYAI